MKKCPKCGNLVDKLYTDNFNPNGICKNCQLKEQNRRGDQFNIGCLVFFVLGLIAIPFIIDVSETEILGINAYGLGVFGLVVAFWVISSSK